MTFTPASNFDSIPVEQYLAAFASVTLTETEQAILNAHYTAPNQTVTATQLARLVGFSRYSLANLRYGRLAGKIVEKLGLHPEFPLATLVTFSKPFGQWEWKLRPQVASAICQLELIDSEIETNFPDEIEDRQHLTEGSACRILVNTYERNSQARKQCLQHYGYECACCQITFRSTYGSKFAKIIHVHHRKPLSTINAKYVVDPIVDLIPVCPNCHAVIHSQNPPYTIDEVKEFLNTPTNDQ